MDAGGRRGDERRRDGVPRAPGRRCVRPALVHSHGGSRPLRSRDARVGPRAMGERLLPAEQRARFHTKSGVLKAWREADMIRMDFPSEPGGAGAAGAVGGGARRPDRVAGKNRMDWLVELEDEAAVRAVRPDLNGVAGSASGASSSPRDPRRRTAISSRASSRPRPAWTRTRSPDRPTAPWRRIGRDGSGSRRCSATRRRRAADTSLARSTGTASSSAAAP